MPPRQIPFAFIFIVAVNITCASYCDKIKETYSSTERYISQHGMPKNITLYWDSDLARAAAAQLSVILRHALGYQHVRLQQIPDNAPPERPCTENGILKEVSISMSAALIKHRLHLRLTEHFRNKTMCSNISKLSSYFDEALLSECGFGEHTTSSRPVIHVIKLNSNNKTMTDVVVADLKASSLPFKYRILDRIDLFRMLRTSNRSFLFFDYDMWDGVPDVNTVKLPLNLNSWTSLAKERLGANIVMNIGDRCLLKEFAPQVLAIADKYAPSLNSLRSILEIESISKNIDEAACKWATLKNYSAINLLIEKYKPKKKNYEILVIMCDEDPDLKEYGELLYFLGMNRLKTTDAKFFIITSIMVLNCSDPDSVIMDIREYMLKNVTSNLIGLIVGGIPNIAEIANIINFHNVPVLFYDANVIDATATKAIGTEEIAIEVGSTSSMWISTGRSSHLTLALQHFILKMGWNRVTVLSSQTRKAKVFRDDLNNLGYLEIFDHRIQHNLTDMEAEEILQEIKLDDTKVILVNSEYKDAVTILTAAIKLKLNVAEKYTWILREWRKNTKIINIKHFVLSFWCKRGYDVQRIGKGQLDYLKKLDELWPRDIWPPQTEALVNAVLSVVEGFDDVIFKYPQYQDDIQSKQVIKQFERSLIEVPVKGLTHTLIYKKHMLEEAVLYVDEWYGYQHKFLAQIRVNATSQKVNFDYVRNKALFGQLLKNNSAMKHIAKGDDSKSTSQTKISYILWVILTFVLVLPLFAIILLHNYIRRRKDTV